MKNILVLTDFSEEATNALKFAMETARLFSAEVTVLNSFQIVDTTYSDFWGLSTEFIQDLQKDLKRRLDRQVQTFRADYKEVKVDTVISLLPLVDIITKVSEERKYDLIVMGKTGATGIGEKIWGSNTTMAIRKTGLPVIVVPKDHKWSKPNKILFLTNQFEKNDKVINTIFEVAGLYLANVIVSIYTDSFTEDIETYLEDHADIKNYEKFLRDHFHEGNLESVHLTGFDFTESVQDLVKEKDIDLLVMVTYQQSFWKRLLNPSMTKQFSHHSEIPLLVIPGKEVQDQ